MDKFSRTTLFLLIFQVRYCLHFSADFEVTFDHNLAPLETSHVGSFLLETSHFGSFLLETSHDGSFPLETSHVGSFVPTLIFDSSKFREI